MITFDKTMMRLNRIARNFLIHLIFWYGSLLFFAFIAGDDRIYSNTLNILQSNDLYVVILVLSAGISALFAFLDAFFSERILRFMPRKLMILFRSFLYFASAFVLLMIAAQPSLTKTNPSEIPAMLLRWAGMDMYFIRFLVYFYLSVFLVHFMKAAVTRIGKGHLKSWIMGMLDKPMEQERIFMFIDMKSSTAIAEQLSHKKFSHLIQDVFNDLQVVDNYHGEIYQYVGDGAIVSWNLKEGLYRNNFLKAFYAFQKIIRRRRLYYKRRYGQEPRFKAGVHAGRVMALQVGRIRREISYNGDTINTAARIESKCNDYKQDLLISGDLYEMLGRKNGFQFRNAGNIKLNGKKKGVDIYKVRRK